MIVLNLLSSLLAWVLRTYSLTPLLTAVVAVFALGNAILGIRLVLDLLRDGDGDGKTQGGPGA